MNKHSRIPILNTHGFTLIELILVISVMGILSAIIVPKFGNLITNMRLKAAGEKIIDDIRYINQYSISHHDTTWLVVDIHNNSYGIYSGPSAGDRQLLLDPSTNQRRKVYLNELYNGVSITSVNFSGQSEFSYNWWGTPSNGGQIVLNNLKKIYVTPGTGYVYEIFGIGPPPPPP